MDLEVDGKRPDKQPRKTWEKTVEKDMSWSDCERKTRWIEEDGEP